MRIGVLLRFQAIQVMRGLCVSTMAMCTATIRVMLVGLGVLEQDGRGNPLWLPLNCIIILWAMVGVGFMPTLECV